MLVAQIPSWSLKQAMEDVMWRGEWVHGPFGLDAERGRTFPSMRTVLVVAHHLTAATRLADIVPLLETDWRVQVAFTYAPSSIFSASAQEFLMGLGGVVLPWHQATQVRFDLAIAAAYGLLEQLHAPVMTVPHGVSFNKYPCRWDGLGPQAPREVAGLEQAGLVYRGRVVPSAIVVPTRRDLARLRNACPAAAPAGIVGGESVLRPAGREPAITGLLPPGAGRGGQEAHSGDLDVGAGFAASPVPGSAVAARR